MKQKNASKLAKQPTSVKNTQRGANTTIISHPIQLLHPDVYKEMVQLSQESAFVADAMLNKIQRRLAYRILEHSIDAKRTDYCIELSLQNALMIIQLNYTLQYDHGDLQPVDWDDDEDNVEMQPPEKDVNATLCMKSITEKQEMLQNLYDDRSMVSLNEKLGKKIALQELEQIRKKHLVLKHGSHNVVGECLDIVSDGAIKIKDPKMLESEDDIAIKVRQEKHDAKQKLLQIEKDHKEKILKDKQRSHEIEALNKELEKGTYTYDFNGNIIFSQPTQGDQLPPDFKFKYKFKRAKRIGGIGYHEDQESLKKVTGRKKQQIPFKDSKQSGCQPADYKTLTRLCDGKQILNIRQTAGSMFEFFKPQEAGVFIKEQTKVKQSKKDFEEINGKMTLEHYYKKINSEGQFMSSMIHPEIQQQLQQSNLLYPKAPGQYTMQPNNNSQVDFKQMEEINEQQEYLNKIRDEFQFNNNQRNLEFSDQHLVVLKSPESLTQLIVFQPQVKKPKQHLQSSALKYSMSQQSNFFPNQSQNTMQPEDDKQQQLTQKQQELKSLTSDLFKLQKKVKSEKQIHTVQNQTQEFRNVFDEMNAQVVSTTGWGYSNATDNLPSLKYKKGAQQNQKSMISNFMNTPKSRQGTSNGFSQSGGLQSRPFSRATQASSSQSLRLKTSTAQSTRRRNIEILSQKQERDKITHLAQPPFGKTVGHGLLNFGNLANYGIANQNNKQVTEFQTQSQNSSIKNDHLPAKQLKLNLNLNHQQKSKFMETPKVERV